MISYSLLLKHFLAVQDSVFLVLSPPVAMVIMTLEVHCGGEAGGMDCTVLRYQRLVCNIALTSFTLRYISVPLKSGSVFGMVV
jgi:hypothetical protein